MIVDRYTNQVVIPVVIICACVFLFMLVQRLSSLSVWDDAHMFVRYADNLLDYGRLSWNPNDANTYGLTSPAYLLIVIPFRILFSTQPALVMILSSLTSGLLALGSMIWLLRKLVSDTVHRLVILILIALVLVIVSDSLTMHLTSGMDTMFTIWLLTLWLGRLYTTDTYGMMGLLGGLLFLARPDALILVGMVFPVLLPSKISYSQSIKYIVGLSASLLFQLLVLGLYFGHPIPLSFYAKNFPIYGEQFYSYYTYTAWQYFLEFVGSYIYLIAIILIGFVTQFHKLRWQDKGLVFGVVVFSIYHILFVVPIMGFSQRFFYPILPVLVILTARVLPPLLAWIPQIFTDRIKQYPFPVLFIPVLLIPALINPIPIVITALQYTQPNEIPAVGIGWFDVQTAYDYLYADSWYRLDELSKLSDDVVIATTEVGLPGVMNPHKRIIDLAGLNQPNFALDGFSADWLMLSENQPDWIYMPFPHYEGMWYTIYEHPIFKMQYEFSPAKTLGTSMDVAIKRNSKFYSDMLDILN